MGGISPSKFLMDSTASAPVAEGNTSVKIRLHESKGGGTWLETFPFKTVESNMSLHETLLKTC